MKYTGTTFEKECKPMDLNELIGRLAVCHHGLIGEIKTAQSSIGGVIVRGRNFLTGERWQSQRPSLLDSEVEKKLRKALAWLKDQEAG